MAYQSKDVEGVSYALPFDYLRAGIHFTLPIKFTFPKGKQPFTVIFNVDVDELDAGTMLGTLMVNPSGGLNRAPNP